MRKDSNYPLLSPGAGMSGGYSYGAGSESESEDEDEEDDDDEENDAHSEWRNQFIVINNYDMRNN